jgi:4-hydroxybenzoyl-CoA reductase alpha subunit
MSGSQKKGGSGVVKGTPSPIHGVDLPGGAVIGRPLRKVDAMAKATGDALYADDYAFPGMLHCKILRSPLPHARIKSIDTSKAEALEGVFGTLVGTEMPTPYCVIPWTRDEHVLCIDKVRYIGDAVAAVAAVDEATATAACRLIEVDYEPLEPVLTLEAARAEPVDEAIHVHNKRGNQHKYVDLEFGAPDEVLKDASVVTDAEYSFQGTTHAAIEPHCAVARVEADGQLLIISATQVPHYLQRDLARVLEMAQQNIRVIQPALGGAFGGKSEPFDLEFCVAKLAQKTGRPVKCLYTREEVFYSHRGRHPMTMGFKVGLDQDGSISAVRSHIGIDGGAYSSFGLVTTYYSGQLLTGPYDFGSYGFTSTRYYTNKPCCGPKRGHGSVQPRFAFECALDEAAAQLGLDPMEVRRRNTLPRETETINGMRIQSNGFAACLEAVRQASDWDARWGKMGAGRGLGVAGSMYISGTNYPVYPNEMPQSGVTVQLDRSGRALVLCGASDIGQGSDSMLAYIVAEELGIEPGHIRVVSSDSDLTPVDLGAYSSRVTFMAGNACIDAARKLAGILREAAAELLELPKGKVRLAGGLAMHVDDTAKHVTMQDVFRQAEANHGTLSASGWYNTPILGGAYRGGTIGASPAYSFTAHVAEVEVDLETGEYRVPKIWVAHDCGRALNPLIVAGQMEGSAYMGAAEVYLEHHDFYPNDHAAPGLHRGPSLLDYPIPTSAEVPDFEALIVESMDPEGPYGAKEAGEGPLHPSIPAVANALYDAIGVRFRSLPITAADVWRALQSKEGN